MKSLPNHFPQHVVFGEVARDFAGRDVSAPEVEGVGFRIAAGAERCLHVAL